jgi:sugar/nucleoside kinase (ribokinase family)
MQKILGLGNALVDMLVQLKNDDLLAEIDFPRGSMQLVDWDQSSAIQEKVNELEKSLASGGSAANTIHGLARLGVETGFIGKVGQDEMAQVFENDLIDNNIKPLLEKTETRSGVALAMISPDSERTFATYLGAAAELKPEDMRDELFEGYDIIHIEGYIVFNQPLLEAALKQAKKHGLKVSLDLASFNVVEANHDFLKDMIAKYVDIVFANEEEAKAYTGQEPQDALLTIAEECELAIVKIGSKGSLIKRGEEFVQAGVIEAKSIDTTGAGDLYASGFLAGLVQGEDLTVCAQMGAITAGNVIQVIGPKMDDARWESIYNTIEEL